jgi:hypothetical protein
MRPSRRPAVAITSANETPREKRESLDDRARIPGRLRRRGSRPRRDRRCRERPPSRRSAASLLENGGSGTTVAAAGAASCSKTHAAVRRPDAPDRRREAPSTDAPPRPVGIFLKLSNESEEGRRRLGGVEPIEVVENEDRSTLRGARRERIGETVEDSVAVPLGPRVEGSTPTSGRDRRRPRASTEGVARRRRSRSTPRPLRDDRGRRERRPPRAPPPSSTRVDSCPTRIPPRTATTGAVGAAPRRSRGAGKARNTRSRATPCRHPRRASTDHGRPGDATAPPPHAHPRGDVPDPGERQASRNAFRGPATFASIDDGSVTGMPVSSSAAVAPSDQKSRTTRSGPGRPP